jgi:transcriptional regulator with PAS, ATPase and Fis domain
MSVPRTTRAADALPQDADSILKLAAQSMFDLFSSMAQGMLLVDRDARVVWINDGYRKFLPALGFERREDFVGRPVEEVIPNTLMRQVVESGKPILIDLLTNQAGTFVVSRIPLRDEKGEVLGALGMVLFEHPETTLQPLIAKFARLQRDLDDARRELATQRRTKYTFASFIGSSPAALEVKRQARRTAQADGNVLLLGETGSGKELIAQAIHAASSRAQKPFVSVNLAAVPETRAPTPGPIARHATVSSSWRTAARCSSTKWATCPARSKASCCVRCRSRRSNRSAPTA